MDFIPPPMTGSTVWVMILLFQILPLVGFVWALFALHRIRASQKSIQQALADIAGRLREGSPR